MLYTHLQGWLAALLPPSDPTTAAQGGLHSLLDTGLQVCSPAGDCASPCALLCFAWLPLCGRHGVVEWGGAGGQGPMQWAGCSISTTLSCPWTHHALSFFWADAPGQSFPHLDACVIQPSMPPSASTLAPYVTQLHKAPCCISQPCGFVKV